MIKLIASDLDGTLLKEGTQDINPAIYDTIRKLKEKGIYGFNDELFRTLSYVREE